MIYTQIVYNMYKYRISTYFYVSTVWFLATLNSWHDSKGHEHKFQYDLSVVHQPRPRITIKIKPGF